MDNTKTKDLLVTYLKKNLAKGYTEDSLKIALIEQGYTRAFIEQAIGQVNKDLAKQAPVLKVKPEIVREIVEEQPEKKSFWKRLFG